MKLLTKNNMKFAVGMFWQIPDHGKKNINLSKLVKDTGHNMFCQIRNISLTYGFCHKDALQGEKKVASLGKYIIETSRLSSEYTNSIICYKFKDAGELDDMGKPLKEDLFGYIVLLNGTICPTDGEYVAEFDLVKNSVIEQSKQHSIETLYLPTDVAAKFFNIFERLDNAFNDDDALLSVFTTANIEQLKIFKEFLEIKVIETISKGLIDYLNTQVSKQNTITQREITQKELNELRQILRHEAFRAKIRDNVLIDNNVRYLIPNIVQVPLSSDEIYWTNTKFKSNYTKSLLQSVSSQTSKKYKIGALLVLCGIFGYFTYDIVTGQDVKLIKPAKPKPMIIKPIPLGPDQLIMLCLGKNDKFFKDLHHWSLTGLKCNSLGSTFMFNSDIDTTINSLIELVGESSGVNLQQKKGVYNKKFTPIKPIFPVSNLPKSQIINNLQQSSIDYSFKLTLPTPSGASAVNKYIINSKVSPVFLLNHGVLNGVKLNEIAMSFDSNSSTYSWTILGEF